MTLVEKGRPAPYSGGSSGRVPIPLWVGPVEPVESQRSLQLSCRLDGRGFRSGNNIPLVQNQRSHRGKQGVHRDSQ
jgi:hypothetical protein